MIIVAQNDIQQISDIDKFEQLLIANDSLKQDIEAIKVEIQSQKQTKKTLENEVKILGKEIISKQEEYDKHIERYDKMKTQYDNKLSEIKRLEREVVEKTKELYALKDEVNKTKQTLANQERKNNELKGVQAQKALPIINKHKGYLNKPLSEMSVTELEKISKECAEYKTDKEMKNFIKKLNSAISVKDKYDEAMKVIGKDVKYNSQNVSNSVNVLSTLQKNSLSAEQKRELNKDISTLIRYAEKVDLLKQYVVFCTIVRNDIKIPANIYKSQLPIMYKLWVEGKGKYALNFEGKGLDKLKTVGLYNNVIEQIQLIPYLKSCYDKLMIAPHTQQPIEAEIMAL